MPLPGEYNMGKIVSVNVSKKKGAIKKPVPEVVLVPGQGVRDDAHAGPGERQVSLLMLESIERQRSLLAGRNQGKCGVSGGKIEELKPGMFAENLTTAGIDLLALRLGEELLVGEQIRLRVSKIGKECHAKCAIYYRLGECVMPREGIFCEVRTGGVARPGDRIERVPEDA
jgi:MOSC domain-containing protein YiiM